MQESPRIFITRARDLPHLAEECEMEPYKRNLHGEIKRESGARQGDK